MGGAAIRRAAALLASVGMLAAVAGCSLVSGSQGANHAALERSTLRIGVQPMLDVAPLYIAQQQKLFEAAGLQVELIAQPTDAEAIRQVDAGTLDVAFATDVTVFRAAGSGVALQLQGEAYQAGQNTMALVTTPGHKYHDLADIARPQVAVNSIDDLGALTTRSVLQVAGVDPTMIKQVAFTDMAAALQSNAVDAAWMMEPYITKAEKTFGAQILSDAARGATLDFPISSYAASRKFADENPKTLAAFRKVLASAQQLAGDPLAVHIVLPSYAEVDSATADLVSVGTYPVSLSTVRLQRVADMMENQHMLGSHLDVQRLLPPTTTN